MGATLLCPPPVALVIYLPINVYTYALHIFSLSIYPMKLHEFFFFLQALAGIFFSSSIPCMNFFLDLTPPPPLPGYLIVHPLCCLTPFHAMCGRNRIADGRMHAQTDEKAENNTHLHAVFGAFSCPTGHV